MHERPKELPQKPADNLRIQQRKKHQSIFERARRAIAQDLSGFLRAVADGPGLSMDIMGEPSVGIYNIPEELWEKRLRNRLRKQPRPWRSHQKFWRKAASTNRRSRRAHIHAHQNT